MFSTITKTYKELGGKFVEIIIKLSPKCDIENVEVNGDFFAIPSEAIDLVEEKLVGVNSVDEAQKLLNKILKSTTLIGISKDRFINIIINAITEGIEKCRK